MYCFLKKSDFFNIVIFEFFFQDCSATVYWHLKIENLKSGFRSGFYCFSQDCYAIVYLCFKFFSLGQDPDNFSQDLLCDCLLVFSKLICIYLGLDLNLNFSRISMRLYSDSSKLIFLHGSRCEFDFFSGLLCNCVLPAGLHVAGVRDRAPAPVVVEKSRRAEKRKLRTRSVRYMVSSSSSSSSCSSSPSGERSNVEEIDVERQRRSRRRHRSASMQTIWKV